MIAMGFWQEVRQDINQHKGLIMLGTLFYGALVLLDIVIILLVW